ncbi:class I SAM-dependent methyltransferase [Streptomyces sp. NBC_01565]|uniref:class I SAM-dependent methyltransferase n=1 Tax=unclassified Streptomyces TaxID=2593676 RepID=UPI00224F6E15|nr:class I SAM-dependent methyltransferase [Streptomyces sp. NBC_01565]MCX4545750.1 class I SAM-dependent methyltransferase [Streptomyces sp. NBC_01565]
MNVRTVAATRWVERWERQQQRYAVDREERFTVISDVVERVTAGHAAPLLLDLGCGPGSLAARLAQRMPAAEVVGVDADPLLLELGRAHHGAALRFAEASIGEPGWLDRLALDRPVDAAVSTTALHYLGEATLCRTYKELAECIRPGGVLVNGDHLEPDSPKVHELAVDIGRRRAERQQALAHEDWESWWSAVRADPELTPLLADRDRRAHPRCEGNDLTLTDHLVLLREAGFEHVGTVWQFGNSHVVVAVR